MKEDPHRTPAEPTVASERIFSGRLLNLRVDTVELANGRTTQREIVEHGESVAIVALDAQDNVLLVRQYRKAVEKNLLEIPAGGLNPHEDPREAAQRELQEETGHGAHKMEHLGGFYSSPGFCTEYLHLYLATDLYPTATPSEEDEDIEVVKVPLMQIPRLIASGEICDSKSHAGLLAVLVRRGQG